MTEANPYLPPESEVATERKKVGGSLSKGLSGDYSFTISQVVGEAWGLVKGFKLTFWGAFLLLMLANLAFGLLAVPFQGNVVLTAAIQIVSMALGYILNAGLIMLSVHRAAGFKVEAMQITSYLSQGGRIVLLNVLVLLLVLLGLMLFVLPGIYLMVAYIFAIPLLLDKKMGIWEAMEASRKTVTHKWFSFLAVLCVAVLIAIMAALLLGVGLVWAMPTVLLIVGVLYTKILGVGEM